MRIPHILKILVPTLAVLGALAAGYAVLRGQRPPENLVLYGNVDIRQVDLAFRVDGRLREVLADEGSRVRTGDVLATLDDDLLVQARDAAEAQLAVQQAQLTRLERGYRVEEVAQAKSSMIAAEAAARNAAIHLRRTQAMRASNAISQRELDNALARNTEAAAQLRAATDQLHMLASGYREEDILAQRAAVQAALAQRDLARIRLDDAVLRAPQEGVILTRAREQGAIVQTGQTVYTLTLTNPTWLRAYVSQPQLGLIKPGMTVEAAVDAAPGKRFRGTVGFIAPTAEFTPKSVETQDVRSSLVYRIRVSVADPDNIMRQGMPVTLYIPLRADGKNPVAPAAANIATLPLD